MDKRLLLSFLLVTLSLEFMATYAQSNTTTVPPANNATTVPPANNATTVAPANNATTVAPANNATTVPPANNATTVPPANNATTVPPANNATTVAPANNATTVAPASNATTVAPASNATTMAPANNATTVASNTLPAVASISRQECGSSKLCAAEPSKCDPSSSTCYFVSAKQQSGQTYNFELSGQTDGYIAAGLSNAASQTASHRAYFCANHKGAVRFFTGFINNLVLNLTQTLNSSNVKGSVNSGKIQCTFSADLPDTTTRAAGYAVSVTTGTYNATSGELGNANFRILTPLVNLSDPTTNVTNLLSNSTNSTSSAYPVTHTQSFLPVLLVTVSLLAFTAV
ncbi:putative ferric-chelate reductase 1 [Xiphophorus maculatus]|uniref:putative ferric-chelate reductase 1 n=1 Tax=Xiphophorus maculatus TaxID=8083 RepID=UPI000C6D5C0B|nr:putative ferric-chelate reductase 1 [Xiphophorus maculatus]